MANDKLIFTRRTALRTGLAGAAALATPTFFIRDAWADDFCNMPKGKEVTFGFNVPQTGPYADEGADQLRAYQLAVKHLNGEGDGGMLKTMKPTGAEGQRRARQEGGLRHRRHPDQVRCGACLRPSA